MSDESVVEILKEGRRRLVRRGGWIRGNYTNDKGGYCALGAIGGPNCSEFTEQALRRALPSSSFGIIDYNDAPGRTKRQILALYDRAIKIAQRETRAKTA